MTVFENKNKKKKQYSYAFHSFFIKEGKSSFEGRLWLSLTLHWGFKLLDASRRIKHSKLSGLASFFSTKKLNNSAQNLQLRFLKTPNFKKFFKIMPRFAIKLPNFPFRKWLRFFNYALSTAQNTLITSYNLKKKKTQRQRYYFDLLIFSFTTYATQTTYAPSFAYPN